jgi:hypothetical protein
MTLRSQKAPTQGEIPRLTPAQPVLRSELQIPRSIIDEYYTNQEKHRPQEQRKFHIQIGTFIVAFLALGVSTYQGCLTRRAVRNSEDSLRLDQRAWVGAVEIDNPSLLDGTRHVYLKQGAAAFFNVVITNTGKTPALKVGTLINWLILPSATPFSPVSGSTTGHPSLTVIQPQMRLTLTTRMENEQVSRERISALASGSHNLYLFGEISYVDIFGDQHRTKFCAMLTPNLDAFGSCNSHNEAD